MTWTVVKVGGSLYDWPMLGERLRAWLNELDAEHVLIVPGGGTAADSVRDYDRVHHLGEETSHWLAIQTMSLNARFLHQLLPEANIVGDLDGISRTERLNYYLLDALSFFQADESSSDALPHSWQVTSDSLAVRVATVTYARELILLKSVNWHGTDWDDAQREGVVDDYFIEALKQTSNALATRIVNLRAWQPSQTSISSAPAR